MFNLNGILSLNTRGFTSGISRAEESTRGLDRSMGRLALGVGSFQVLRVFVPRMKEPNKKDLTEAFQNKLLMQLSKEKMKKQLNRKYKMFLILDKKQLQQRESKKESTF